MKSPFKIREKRARPQQKAIAASKLKERLNHQVLSNTPKRLVNVCVTYPNGRMGVHEFKSSQGALKFIKEQIMEGHEIRVNAVWGE